MPILPALAASSVGLELRPLPSIGFHRLPRYYGPLRRLTRPGLSLAGCQLEVHAPPPCGLPVLHQVSLCTHATATTPAEPLGQVARWAKRRACGRRDLSVDRPFVCRCLTRPTMARPPLLPVPSDGSLPPYLRGSTSALGVFGAYSAFTRVAACVLAEGPEAPLYTGGLDCFVTSTAAPIATGWSESCQAGLGTAPAPAEDLCLSTAHQVCTPYRRRSRVGPRDRRRAE